MGRPGDNGGGVPDPGGATSVRPDEQTQRDMLPQALEVLDTPVFIKDDRHRWVYLNDAACRVLGHSREEMLGKTDTDVYPPEYATFLWEKDDHVLATGESVTYESRAPWRGRGHYVLTRKSLYQDPQGGRFVVGVIQDLKDSRTTDGALRDSEAKLRKILDSARVGVLVISHGHILIANPYVEEISGYAPDEVLDADLSAFIHPDDKEMIARHHRARMSGGEVPSHYLARIIDKRGRPRWVGISGVTIDWEGELASLNFISDLSDLKRAQDALARSERQLRQVVDLVPHMIYARDAGGRFLMLNKTMARALGGTVEELTGRDAGDMDDGGGLLAPLERLDGEVRASGRAVTVPGLEVRDFTGRPRKLECTARPFGGTGAERGVLGVCTDITRTSRMLDRLERLNNVLLGFGSDPEENIAALVACSGELLDGDCALYSRLRDEAIETVGVWREPDGFIRYDAARGHVCADVAHGGDGDCVVIRDLQATAYAESDPNVRKYGLRTYIGVPVRGAGEVFGTLCVVYVEKVSPVREDEWLLSMIGAAILVEERRLAAVTALRVREAALGALFGATPDQMILLDGDGVVQAANVRAAELLDALPEELPGMRLEELLSPERHSLLSGVFEQVLESAETATFSEKLEGRYYAHRISPVLDASGGVGGFALYTRDVTEEKKAQREILESEDRFRATFEQSAVGIAHLDGDGRYLLVNDKLCDVLGYSREELMGMRFQDVTAPDDLEENMLLHRRMVQGDLPSFSMEKRYRRKDGKGVWVNITVSAIMDPEGRYKYNCTVVEDITLRKQIENALLRRDAVLEAVGYAAEKFLLVADWRERIGEVLETFATAADASRAYIFQNKTGGDGRLCMSQRFEWTAPGVPPELDNPMLKALPYEEAGLDLLQSTLSGKRPFYGRVSDLPRPDRDVLEPQGIKSLAIVPIFVQDEWWGFVGFDDCEQEREWLPAELEALMAAADILGNAMARKRIEQALRESERKFRIIAETLSDVFWISTPDRRRMLYVSPAYERYLGPREDVMRDGESFYGFVHEEDRDRVKSHYRETPGQGGEIEYRIHALDGSVVWVRERAFPVVGAEGEVDWLAGVSMDITESRNTREAIRSSLREKELLLQEVHHRVKNNLQIISSLLDMAGRRIVDPKAREIMRDTQSKIHSMAMIHLQLYGYERFDSIDIASYAKLLTWQLGQMYNAGEVAQEFDLEETFLPLSKAIPCGLVLSEALSNAYKHAFSRGRSGTLTVRVGQQGDDGTVQIVIADDGVGLPPGFEEAGQSSVGLKLLGNIVRFQLGGELDIASNNGTRVTIRFNKQDEGGTS